MDLLRLAEEIGLEPFKTSNVGGGEFHSSCPRCGGKDRFILWPLKNQYWCRQCNAKGDAIQFCRDFLGISFRNACIKLQKQLSDRTFQPKNRVVTLLPRTPSASWKEKALQFAKDAHQNLLTDGKSIELVMRRGLTMATIRKNSIGWNPVKMYKKPSDWGIEEMERRQWLCLPKGLVIPLFHLQCLPAVEVRERMTVEDRIIIAMVRHLTHMTVGIRGITATDHLPERMTAGILGTIAGNASK